GAGRAYAGARRSVMQAWGLPYGRRAWRRPLGARRAWAAIYDAAFFFQHEREAKDKEKQGFCKVLHSTSSLELRGFILGNF
ncbi:hypothetical protein A2U01_0066054, partial [Trifolium medium]|nr:hypothetical protein [Trifolium medium]